MSRGGDVVMKARSYLEILKTVGIEWDVERWLCDDKTKGIWRDTEGYVDRLSRYEQDYVDRMECQEVVML
eukprot:3858031-Ditylum_brightwellii.AAC.1